MPTHAEYTRLASTDAKHAFLWLGMASWCTDQIDAAPLDSIDRTVIKMLREGATRNHISVTLDVSHVAISKRIGRIWKKMDAHPETDAALIFQLVKRGWCL